VPVSMKSVLMPPDPPLGQRLSSRADRCRILRLRSEHAVLACSLRAPCSESLPFAQWVLRHQHRLIRPAVHHGILRQSASAPAVIHLTQRAGRFSTYLVAWHSFPHTGRPGLADPTPTGLVAITTRTSAITHYKFGATHTIEFDAPRGADTQKECVGERPLFFEVGLCR
jgi:hypothetical protein